MGNEDVILEKVKRIIAESGEVPYSEIKENSRLYGGDLGLSSLGMIEVIVRIEESFDTEMPDEMLSRNVTVKDLVDWLMECE